MNNIAQTLVRVHTHTHTHTGSLENRKIKNIEKDSNMNL